MSKLNNNFNALKLNTNTSSQISSLFCQDSEDEYLKAIEESNDNFRKLQEKVKNNKNSSNNSEEEEEDEDSKQQDSQEYIDDYEEDEDEEDNKGIGNFIKNTIKKVGASSLLSTGLSFGSIGIISTFLISAYRIHYDGEFEFKGIGGEYQNFSFKKMNFLSFNKSGDIQLGGLTKENKLTKAYYTLYSDNSYYAVVEDSNKYSNPDDAYKRENLLTPEELREQYPDIQDAEQREKMFQLNPDVLYSLDRYLHKNQFLYPQQFIKPVYYEEKKDDFKLKDLVKNGKVEPKSQIFNLDGTPAKNDDGSLKKETGIWDYGLASVLLYKEYEVKERTTADISGVKMVYKGLSSDSFNGEIATDKNLPKVGDEVSKTINNNTPASQHPNKPTGTSSETVRKEPAYAIEKAVTAGGTITSNIVQRWQDKEGGRKTEILTDTIKETEIIEVETEEDLDGDGKLDIVQKERTHIYEVSYVYEISIEEYVPCYDGDLDTSGIVGSKYYREYIGNYSNYIPIDVPNKLNYNVFNNEEVSNIFVDDSPNAYGGGGMGGASTSTVATEQEFNNAVFMGDSITVGLETSNTIPKERVFAESGFTVYQGDKKFANDIIAKKPPVIVISYGTNDAGYNDTSKYNEDFKSLINKFKTNLPGVKIYINKIFPGNSSKASTKTEKDIISNISTHNSELSQIASETGATLIDCTGISNLQSYYSDAFHFKSDFYKVWLEEMKKQIVQGASSSNNINSNGNSSGNLTTGSVNNSSTSTSTSTSTSSSSVKIPPARQGEDRSLSDIVTIGKNKDTAKAQNGLKWMNLATVYGETYGIDPYIICAIIATESDGYEKTDNGSAAGLMGILHSHNGSKFEAYNHKTNSMETLVFDSSKIYDPEYNVHAGTLMLAESASILNHNVLMSVQGHNLGPYGFRQAILYYLSEGKRNKVNFTLTKEEAKNAYEYAGLNHNGWILAQYPGDLPKEKMYQNGHGYLNPNDGYHDAMTWYADAYKGQSFYIYEVLEFYAGDGSPWMKRPDGTIMTVDGVASSYGSGNSSAISAFNSYLASNWETILEKKEILYPWTKELDIQLYNDKKGDYINAKLGDLPVRREALFTSNLTGTDIDIVLGMMFALNQGNYLSKYDYMGEAEWKAMYNQLLSSPTGKTWDDKWIGFTCEEIFGKSLEDLGTLFKEGSGVNPTISRSFGKLKNIYSDDTNTLPQYNETNFGIDLSIPKDTEVLALEDGEIVSISKNDDILSRYGNFVQIKFTNGNNVRMVIANLKSVNKKIKVGATVSKGDVIGTTGGKCKSYKDGDLHIELLHNENFINPEWIITRDMIGFDDPIQGNATGGSGGVSLEVSNIELVNKVLEEARKHIGKPYVWAGIGPDGFDCSGFMYYIMKQAGVPIKGRETAISFRNRKDVVNITREQIQPGDLVFWHDLTGRKHSPVFHIGIYAGNDEIIDCSPDHKGVGTRTLSGLKDIPGNRYFTFGRFTLLSGGSSDTQ